MLRTIGAHVFRTERRYSQMHALRLIAEIAGMLDRTLRVRIRDTGIQYCQIIDRARFQTVGASACCNDVAMENLQRYKSKSASSPSLPLSQRERNGASMVSTGVGVGALGFEASIVGVGTTKSIHRSLSHLSRGVISGSFPLFPAELTQTSCTL